MNTDTSKDYSLTTFDYVVVEKDRLLSKLKENREGHSAIYEAAVSGYWVQAKQVLDEKKQEFTTAIGKATDTFNESFSERDQAVSDKNLKGIGGIAAYFSFNTHWPLSYPTNKLEDYDRVISMLEFSVADKVQLKSTDFDCYVRNNWSWTRDFAASNQGYVGMIISGMSCGVSGALLSSPLGRFALSGAQALTSR